MANLQNSTTWNVSNATNDTICSVFETEAYIIVALVSASTATLSMLACLGVIILMFALKKYLFFIQRLILYLCISALLNSAAIALRFQEAFDLSGSKESNGLRILCIFTAFVDQTTAWSETIAFCCITINLLLTAVFKKDTEKLEAVYIFMIFIFPFTFNWLPFIHDAYGEAGAWCWIRALDDNCDPIQFGMYLRLFIWYVPNYIIILAVILVYVFIVAWVTRQKRRWAGKYDAETETQKSNLQKEVWPLLFYPLGFLLLNIFPLINRIHDTVVEDTPIYALWMLHAIFSPLQGGYIALVYTLDRETLKRLKITRVKAAIFHHEAKITEYPAQRGFSDSFNEPNEPKYTSYVDKHKQDDEDKNKSLPKI